MKFRLIPPGEFLRGAAVEVITATVQNSGSAAYQEKLRSQGPQHKVILTQPMYLGMHEVTQGQYRAVLGQAVSHFSVTGGGQAAVQGLDTTMHPADSTSWDDATQFCGRLSQREKLAPFVFLDTQPVITPTGTGYRLPTEAEWEYACRAGTLTKFWSGDTHEDMLKAGWIGDNSGKRTHAVGESRANPFGLCDQHGNVWEWVLDSFNPQDYELFAKAPAIDPIRNSRSNPQRGLRGGSWAYGSTDCWSSFRHAEPSTLRHRNVGFRAALSVDAVKAALGKPIQAAATPTAETPLKADSDQSARTLKGSPFTSVAYSPDGKWIATAAINRTVTLWDAVKAQPVRTLNGGWCVAFDPDSQRLASAGPENSVRVWNVATGEETLVLKGHTGDVRSVAFNRDGTQIGSASADKTVRLWDAKTGQLLKTFEGHTDDIRAVVFGPEAKRLVSASKDMTVRVWPLDMRGKLRVLTGHTAEVRTVAFSGDLESIVSGGHDATVRQWAGFEGGLIKQHGHHASGVMSLAISDDLQWVVTAGSDRLIKISSMKTGHEQVSLSGHTSQVVGVAWHPLGKRVASVSYDGTLRLWDVAEALKKPTSPASGKKSVTREVSAEEGKLIEAAEKTSRPLTNGDLKDLSGWTRDAGAMKFRSFATTGQQTALTTAGTPIDESTGRIYQCFKVPADATELRFFLHGGADIQCTYVALWNGKDEVRRAAGRNDNAPFHVAWNIESLRGRVVTLEIIDQSTSPWGFIGVHGFEVLTQQTTAASPRKVGVRVTQAVQESLLTFSLRGDLRELGIHGTAASPELLTALARFKNLEALQLSDMELSDDVASELARHSNLKQLSSAKSKPAKPDKPELSDKGLQALESLPKLKSLELYGHGIDGNKLQMINEKLRSRQ